MASFLGEKLVRKIPMLEGVEVVESGTKDEISISGNDIDNVSQSAANIHQVRRRLEQSACANERTVLFG